MNTDSRARREQFRQARQIHGGALNMCAATLGVRLSRLPIPSRRLRERVYRTVYGRKYKALNEEELDRPLVEFRSLNELFTRGIRPECRPIADSDAQLVCPCDSTIQDIGQLEHDTLLTVKGINYSLDSLLPALDTASFHNGWFAIFFLSPADCHRVFAPDTGLLHKITHVPGRRLLVHPPYQKKEFPVFSLNARIIIELSTPVGNCILIMVAGWGVGHITHPFNNPVRPRRSRITQHTPKPSLPVKRGEWIATFGLGSTVILITEPDDSIIPRLVRDQQVIYGQPAFSFRGECPVLPPDPVPSRPNPAKTPYQQRQSRN